MPVPNRNGALPPLDKNKRNLQVDKCLTVTTTLNRALGAGAAQPVLKIPHAEREQFWKFAKENISNAIKHDNYFLD